jgi:FkbM family methyltransferase
MMRDHIFDLGMNNGDDTAFYLSQGYKVVAVEANPIMVELGRRRFWKELDSGKLQILNVGISQTDGFGEFWICEEKPQFSSFVRESAARDSHQHYRITVPTLRPASLFERFGVPYYLKIDVEGNEQICLSDLSECDLPQYISLECHHFEDQGDQGLLSLERLSRLGYRRFKLINQFSLCAMSIPPGFRLTLDSLARYFIGQPPLNRVTGTYWISRRLIVRIKLEHRFGWQFPMGSSGVWGEDTDGGWMGYEQAKHSYSHYLQLYKRANPNLFWCDWHATL